METEIKSRVYVPTFSELVDRLCIVQMKAIFISKEDYAEEIKLIMKDLDTILKEENKREFINAEVLRSILVLAISNRFIWENESKAREGGDEQDKLLKLTHSINGVRNTAKNVISYIFKERVDLKIDCFAGEFAKYYGNWDIWKK